MTFAVILCSFIIAVCFSESVLSMEPRIFGGNPLNPNIHKYLVKLHIHNEKGDFHCSGSILSSRWILTAAHCVLPKGPATIYVTHHNDGNKEIIAEIKHAFTHPRYIFREDGWVLKEDESANDIALLKTMKKIELDDNVNTINLMDPEMKVIWATVVGYGFSERYNEPNEGNVRLYKCGNKSAVLCSIGNVRVAGGDSGGPVVANGTVVGVTSASCKDVEVNGNCQSIYANILENYKWIESIQSVE